VVVDYLPPSRRDAARAAARRIEAMGFTPWIATPELDVLGVGSVEVFPRRMLLLYDGAETPSLEQSPIHRWGTVPVEYIGCAADYLDVRRGLPRAPLSGQYAGIVTWFTDDELPDSLGYPQWLAQQIDAGVRVVMFGRPGFSVSKSFLAKLGLAAVETPPTRPLRTVERDELIGFEAEPELRIRGLSAWRATSSEASVHLRIEDANGQAFDPVVTAPWGGIALDPYVLDVGYEGRARWIVDPFSFLEQAFGSRAAPVLDLSTENGARLLVVTADGEGFARAAGRGTSTAGEVILREMLSAVPVPTSVAMRPGDIGDASPNLAGVAKAIFALPYVEPAGHLADPASGNPQSVANPSVTELSPTGRPAGAAYRVYLPGWNASGASRWWDAKAFDLEHLTALADRGEAPRRLKPIGLFYHFWIATKPAALHALKQAVRWALDGGALPLWASEYAARVLDFRAASTARRLDGTWQFRGLGRLRTVRVPRALGWPDLSRSRGVAGVSEAGEWRYVSFGPEEKPTLALSEDAPRGPYLVWANAQLVHWSSRGGTVALRLRGHQPVRFAVAAAACTLTAHGRRIRPALAAGRETFSVAEPDTGEAHLECGNE
jgi:hypothetical protein